jgi:hypothetical protein
MALADNVLNMGLKPPLWGGILFFHELKLVAIKKELFYVPLLRQDGEK